MFGAGKASTGADAWGQIQIVIPSYRWAGLGWGRDVWAGPSSKDNRLGNKKQEACSEAWLADFHGYFYALVLPLVSYWPLFLLISWQLIFLGFLVCTHIISAGYKSKHEFNPCPMSSAVLSAVWPVPSFMRWLSLFPGQRKWALAPSNIPKWCTIPSEWCSFSMKFLTFMW